MVRLSLTTRRKRRPEDRRVADALEVRIAGLLGLEEGDVVTVNEIACADRGCPDVETVVLVMRRGERTRAVKIPKAMQQIEEADIREAIGAAGTVHASKCRPGASSHSSPPSRPKTSDPR